MILYRYINRQLFVTMAVVAFVLTMVLVSGRFINYLARAASGDISADALFLILAFRMPEFLQMILPLSLFIAILLVFGRLQTDNELVVIRSGGVGQLSLLRGMALPIIMTTLVVGFFALYVTPRGISEVNRILAQQDQRSVLELLTPGRFQSRVTRNQQRATYAEKLDRKNGVLGNVFLSELQYNRGKSEQGKVVTIRARTGRVVERDGVNYLQLTDGHQYQGRPGDADYRVVAFDKTLIRIGNDRNKPIPHEVRGRSTLDLISNPEGQGLAELEWRVSLVLLVPLMMLFVVPMTRFNPRQGTFIRLLPAMGVYMLYLGMLMAMHSWIGDAAKKGAVPWYLNVAWVHIPVVLLIVVLYLWPEIPRRRRA